MVLGKVVKVFLTPQRDARCLKRIETALREHLPSHLEITEEYGKADLHVMYIIGRHDHRTREAQKLLSDGKRYAVIQIVLGSCRNPDPADWQELWGGADVVWSYYDLPGDFNFYRAPLAAEPKMFYKEDIEKEYQVGCQSDDFKRECVGELQFALWYVRKEKRGAHVGTNFNSNPLVDYYQNISDDEMRTLYNKCKWFSCLRRKDGFEMPAVEALMCGVRPIMFDQPYFRHWFDGLAWFIPEGSPQNVAASLMGVLKHDPKPVAPEEIEETRRRFNWKQIVEGFYARLDHPDTRPK